MAENEKKKKLLRSIIDRIFGRVLFVSVLKGCNTKKGRHRSSLLWSSFFTDTKLISDICYFPLGTTYYTGTLHTEKACTYTHIHRDTEQTSTQKNNKNIEQNPPTSILHDSWILDFQNLYKFIQYFNIYHFKAILKFLLWYRDQKEGLFDVETTEISIQRSCFCHLWNVLSKNDNLISHITLS